MYARDISSMARRSAFTENTKLSIEIQKIQMETARLNMETHSIKMENI